MPAGQVRRRWAVAVLPLRNESGVERKIEQQSDPDVMQDGHQPIVDSFRRQDCGFR